ncbi:MAG: phage baseplate assembly protein V [Kofleriaceae bacterium]
MQGTKDTDRVAGMIRDQAGTLYGKYRGTVSTVGTGDDLGKIRAYIPSVLAQNQESIWIEPAVPFAGKDHGMLFLPEKGDGVWIEFEAGHPWLPIWTGFWWGKDQKPKTATEKVRVITTSHGHQIVLDDDKDELRLEHGNGPSIVMTKDKITIKVGSKQIVLDDSSCNVNNGNLKVT